jgi:hypothetical protein|nr:MAG TPA: hypothetical protein [Caudoviricetes sp.]
METIIVGVIVVAMLFGFGKRQLHRAGNVVDKALSAAERLADVADASAATLQEETHARLAARKASRK